jgi:hypothetical protein
MSKILLGLFAGALLALTVVLLCDPSGQAGTKVQVGKPCSAANRPSLAEIDHAALNDLLHKYVDDKGLVAYARWKANAADMQALDAYLARVGCVDLAKPAEKSSQIAYWVNVYNALTLKGILREYPIKSIRDRAGRLGGYNIWKDLLLWVDNRNLSLDDIEHQILRRMGEPRIHSALVCGAKGCPPLSQHAYTAPELDDQLTANGRRFFARPESFQADPRRGTIYLSPILKWYGDDFGTTTPEQLRVLRPLLPAANGAELADKPGVNVRYLDYDWNLNDQQPPSR